KPIDEASKFKIDQYLMKGGKILFFLDGLKVDTVGLEGSFAQPLNIGLDDMLFKYGVRINKNIVKDGQNAALVPMVVGNMGNTPQMEPVQYRYYPLVNNFGNSIITKNINLVLCKYAASIDTIDSGYPLKKTPLLKTSPYTKVLNAPALITFNEAKTDTDPKEYNKGEKILGLLVEGSFKSLFDHQIGGGGIKKSPITKIIVCSDGDLVVNEVEQKTNNPFPLGYDKYANFQYGNQDFVVNALNYLLDESGIISAQAKNIQLRPLDKIKIKSGRNFWPMVNVVCPILLVVLLGGIRFWYLNRTHISIS
ncbi:MAG: Gldg family protein, partial [Leadbetterella sp.]